jgi:large subunit ribosomal protein L23
LVTKKLEFFLELSIEIIYKKNVLMMLDLVKHPVIRTEKATRLVEKNQLSFDVDVRLTKTQIRKLIQEFFNVKVLAVNTHRPPRKRNRLGSKPSYKRVIVTVDSDVTLLK